MKVANRQRRIRTGGIIGLNIISTREGVPQKKEQFHSQQKGKPETYIPVSNAPQGRWTKPAGKGQQVGN